MRQSRLWVRPIDMFNENVVINGKTIPRFKYISSFNNKLPEFVEPSDRKPK